MAARIYKTTDQIKLEIEGITFLVSPLSFLQKSEINTQMTEAVKGNVEAAMKGSILAVKYAVKSVQGLEDSEGQPYDLSFDENGLVSDSCIDDLLNLEVSNKLVMVCASLINGIRSEEIIDPSTRKPIEGVKFGGGSESTNPKPKSSEKKKAATS